MMQHSFAHRITSRRILILVSLALLIPALPISLAAQTDSPTPLPYVYQVAVDTGIARGIAAAKASDYPQAIYYFQEVRKITPNAPMIFFNLGLVESKIPGRELRAIAWFGAYLAANPDSPNAAAVRRQIDVLVAKNQSNTLQLLKTVLDEANKVPGDKDTYIRDVVLLLAKAGDTAGALRTEALIQDAGYKQYTQLAIIEGQLEAGDIAGAVKIARPYRFYPGIVRDVAEAQAKSGDIAGALETARVVSHAFYKTQALSLIAEVQAKSGDGAGAQKTFLEAQQTAELVQDAPSLTMARLYIADRQAKARSKDAPKSTRPSKSDWIERLDDNFKGHDIHFDTDCALNTEPFLNLTGYLKTLTRSEKHHEKFYSLYKTAQKIVAAQHVITGMLEQQAGK